jgi:hypothetical protein
MLTEKFKWNANYVNAIEAIIGFGLLGITFFHRSKDVILKEYASLALQLISYAPRDG